VLLHKYPGLVRGEARLRAVEEILRIAAMLPVTEEIGGFPVVRLTPRHFDLLILANSPFLYRKDRPGCPVRYLEDVAQFLWNISTDNPFNQKTWWRVLSFILSGFRSLLSGSHRLRFCRRLRRLIDTNPQLGPRLERAIDRYLDRMQFDKPPAGNGREIHTATSAAIVNKISGAYGWPDEVLDLFGLPIPGAGIMDKPLSRLYQYWRWITVDKNPSAPLFSSKTESFRARTQEKWRARAEAAGFTDDPIGSLYRLDAVEKYLISIGKLPPWRPPGNINSQP
jgi:hypothetical protein